MTIYLHELRQERKTFWIWALSILFFTAICIFFYPEMKKQMKGISDLFSTMGVFSTAFGMDKLDFGTLLGFYAVECGNIIGLGGGLFAAMSAANRISKEEKNRTAEFLFTHPLKRSNVLLSKLLAFTTEVTILNVIVTTGSLLSMAAIGESIPWKEMGMMHLAFYVSHLEIGLICFGISAFTRSNNFGLGLGLALIFYFMNILANISEKAKIMKILSPFGYADAAGILTEKALDWKLMVMGLVIGILVTGAGIVYYQRKDLQW